jgi:hypothetical protein
MEPALGAPQPAKEAFSRRGPTGEPRALQRMGKTATGASGAVTANPAVPLLLSSVPSSRRLPLSACIPEVVLTHECHILARMATSRSVTALLAEGNLGKTTTHLTEALE